MKKNKKIIITLTLCAVIAAAAVIILILLSKPGVIGAIENTKWISLDDASVLTLTKSGKEGSYDWTLEDNSRKGAFIAYAGEKAEARLDEFTQAYLEAEGDDVPDGEKYGFEDEIEKIKKDLKEDNAFLLEETDISINGEEPKSKELAYRHIYLGTIQKSKGDDGNEQTYMTLMNVRSYNPYALVPYSEEKHKEIQEERANAYKAIKPLDDDGKDKNFGVKSYTIPAGYCKWASEEGYLSFIMKESPLNEIVVSIMEETPLYGIADEFPEKEETTLGSVKGYLVKEEIGPGFKYYFLFENNGSTYMIEAKDEKALTDLVSSIEL